MWHDQWIEMASPVIDHSVHLLRALRTKGIPVHALTNFGIQSFDYAETKYPFLGEFDKRYISGHMAVTKPDTKIYEMVEADCGVAPENLLFADDRSDNIDIALKRGWNAHLFETAQGWAEELVKHNLLTVDVARI
jgi:2-haloacid dehalogenase